MLYLFLLLFLLSLGFSLWLWGSRAALLARLQAAQEQLVREHELAQETLKAQLTLTRQELRRQFDTEMEERTRQLRAANDTAMHQVVGPLKEELLRLQTLLNQQRAEHMRQTGSLEASIKAVIRHDQERDRTTHALADALKNRGKVQGDWGEMVLENILRDSGLREGVEYVVQPSVTKDDGRRDRPDVVVHGADGATVIIDSKVSLTAYSDYCGAADDNERQQAVRQNHQSLWQHVVELAQKKYPATIGGAAPVVLMFVPNEGSYILAMNHDPQLSIKAYNKNVLIVNPTNLMVVLRLIFLTWRQSHQEENNRSIVDAATRMYEKYATFVQSYTQLGSQLSTLRNTYERGLGQLAEGRGNLSKQMNDLLDLGITPTKKLDLPDTQ